MKYMLKHYIKFRPRSPFSNINREKTSIKRKKIRTLAYYVTTAGEHRIPQQKHNHA